MYVIYLCISMYIIYHIIINKITKLTTLISLIKKSDKCISIFMRNKIIEKNTPVLMPVTRIV